MGNKAFKELQSKPLGKGSMSGDEPYIVFPLTTKQGEYKIKTKGILKTTTEIIDVETDQVISSSEANSSLKLQVKTRCFGQDGSLASLQVSKSSFKGKKVWIYKTSPVFEGQAASEEKIGEDDDTDLYLTARIVVKDTMTTAEGVVEVVVGEDSEDESGFEYKQIMKAYKISTMGFNAYVEDMNGECLGKCSPKSKMSVDVVYSIAAGVDASYVMAALMYCNPGGAGAGAAAGAGAF